CTHQMHAGSHVSHRRLGTPAHWGRAHRGPSRPLHRRTLKRRHHRQADNDMGLSQPGKLLLHTEDSAEDMGPPHSTHALQRGSQFPVRRKNGENVYSINNIIIPASLTACSKVDKLQYKDILTPSWRLVDIVPLVQKEEEEEEDLEKARMLGVSSPPQVEVLSDEVFSHRHQGCEGRERLHWDYWGKGRRYSRSSRLSNSGCFEGPAGDRPADVHGDVPVSSGQSWTFSTPGVALQEDVEAQMPWERRVFPLCGQDEDALRCDEDDKAPQALWSERHDLESSSAEGRGKNSAASPCYAPTTPPAGCEGKDTHRAQGWLR
ncbi:hypothetical protein P4O66_015096, partial [Electrophorus voltai]